jgi:F0F1-type ATP synthase membrane subunit c/vacuolar-type H+-ATPase subunit K
MIFKEVKSGSPYLPLGLLLLFVLLASWFSISDHLAGFSDDSATYLIMAGNLSPYDDVPESHRLSYHYDHLPPGFHVLAAVLGIHPNIELLHALILFELVIALVLFSLLCKSLLPRNQYLIPVIMFAMSPGLWMEMLRITSEHQYMLLSLAVILMLHKYPRSNVSTLFVIALLVGLAILTRTIGISLLMAFFVHMLIRDKTKSAHRTFLILFACLIPAAIWNATKPDITYSYISDLMDTYSKLELYQIFLMIGSSMEALGNAWIQNIALRPEAINKFQLIMAITLGLFIIPGLIIRKGSPETLYILFYLGIAVIWPYSDEMPRFLYPVMPFLILYAYTGLTGAFNALNWGIARFPAIVAIILSIYVPSTLAIYERYKIGYDAAKTQVTYIPELYTIHSSDKAVSTAVSWHETLNFMESLKPIHEGYGLTLTIKPQFLTFLSDIYAEKIPLYERRYEKEYFEYIYQQNARHLLISTIPVTKQGQDTNIIEVLKKIADERFSLVYMNHDQRVTIATMMDIRRR